MTEVDMLFWNRHLQKFVFLLCALLLAACKPTANNQTVVTTANTPVAITLTATNNPLSYEVNTQPTGGSLSGTPPQVTYTPNPNYAGQDNFTFTASNKDGVSNIANIAITVEPALQKPTAIFSTSSDVLSPGQSLTLNWEVTNADSITIDPIGPVNQSGSYSTTITSDTTFTLTATGKGGTVQKFVTIYLNNLELEILTPVNNQNLDSITTTVKGHFKAPLNSSITVNGVGALLQDDQFVATNIQLDAGSNTIKAILKTQSGLTLEKTTNVSTLLAFPLLSATVNQSEGMIPFKTKLNTRYIGEHPLKELSIDFDGNGNVDYRGAQTEDIEFEYTLRGHYEIKIHAEDMEGNTFSTSQYVVAHDRKDIADLFNGILSKHNQSLINGEVGKALDLIHSSSKRQYAPIFNELLPQMADIVSAQSPMQLTSFSPKFTEFAITRKIGSEENVFFIYFMKDGDGVWRIQSM